MVIAVTGGRMIHPEKKGIRALGIAESFKRGYPLSALAGVVMRADWKIDGFACSVATVGGMDATDAVLKIFRNLDRSDINVILLNGCVISFFNIIDIERVHLETSLPVICVTYEESEGLEKYLSEYFPGDQSRIEAYRRLGERKKIEIDGTELYIRAEGISDADAKRVLAKFTPSGAIPEPLRVARIIARGIMRMLHETGNQSLYSGRE